MREVRMTFSEAMALATWRGEKGETRRLPPALDEINLRPNEWLIDGWDGGRTLFRSQANNARVRVVEVKPTCLPGDVLVVAEPWRTWAEWDNYKPSQLADWAKHQASVSISYSDGYAIEWPMGHENPRVGTWGRYRHARFMPNAFARTRRKIVEVRFEPLGDVTEEAAENEGVRQWSQDVALKSQKLMNRWCRYSVDICKSKNEPRPLASNWRGAFATLWDVLHGDDAWAIDQHKWVQVTKYERRAGA